MLRNVAGEIARARTLAADRRSFLRWSADILAYRLLRLVRLPGHNRPRTITLKGGARLTYRLNRGDVLTLREVWIDEVYRVADLRRVRSVLDLGANIGLASVWFAYRYGCEEILAVEPLPENVVLLRHNLRQNGIAGRVMQCAVAATEGSALLAVSAEPNSAHLAPQGLPVRIASMASVIEELDRADLVKVDIEGAEEALFGGDLRWLERVNAVVAEIHAATATTERIASSMQEAGFSVTTTGRMADNSIVTFSRAPSR